MNRDKLINLKNYEYAFNTSEAYSMNAYLRGDSLLIPYLNIQISDENPFGIKVGEKIDFSYMLLSGISNIQWNVGYDIGENIIGELKIKNQNTDTLTDYFGFNKRNEGYEIKIRFEKKEVFVPSGAKTSKNEWIPWDTPNFVQNLNSEEIKKFFEAEQLPRIIKEKFNRKESIILEFKNSEKKVIEEIINKW